MVIREDKVSLDLTEEILQSMEVGMAFRDYNGRISSMDFHRTSNFLVTASDDESIRLYDVANATCLKTINSKKYGVDLVCFTSHPTTVIYSSKNGWDGMSIKIMFANHCGSSHCMTTSTCGISKDTMTGLSP
ncbi:hypothetical protein CsSME_00003283 [Camellia sinensis var. sinensis]